MDLCDHLKHNVIYAISRDEISDHSETNHSYEKNPEPTDGALHLHFDLGQIVGQAI